MIIDIYSRKIVAWEVWTEENGELASELVERALLSEKAKGKPTVLHFKTLKYRNFLSPCDNPLDKHWVQN